MNTPLLYRLNVVGFVFATLGTCQILEKYATPTRAEVCDTRSLVLDGVHKIVKVFESNLHRHNRSDMIIAFFSAKEYLLNIRTADIAKLDAECRTSTNIKPLIRSINALANQLKAIDKEFKLGTKSRYNPIKPHVCLAALPVYQIGSHRRTCPTLQRIFNITMNMESETEMHDQVATCMDNVVSPGCEATEVCGQAVVNNLGFGGYNLSHQILVAQMADYYDCKPVIRHHYKGSILKFLDRACLRAYERSLEEMSYRLEFQTDMLIETLLLCGESGYQEFKRLDWTRQIIDLIDDTGCMNYLTGKSHKDPYKWLDPEMEGYFDDGDMGGDLIRDDGCSSHANGLAISYLTGIMHYIYTYLIHVVV